MKKFLIFLCASLLLFVTHLAAYAIPTNNLVTNGTFDGDGSPWTIEGNANINFEDEFGNPFALFGFSPETESGGGIVSQLINIPDVVDTLYLDLDYGFFEPNDDNSDDGLGEDGLPTNTAFLFVQLFNDEDNLFNIATESSIDPDYETYDDILSSHFSVSFDASELAGDSVTFRIGGVTNSSDNVFVGIVDNVILSTTPVPEPSTLLLLGTGLVGIAGFGRKKFFKK